MNEELGKLRIAFDVDTASLNRDISKMKKSLSMVQQEFKTNAAGVDKYNMSIQDMENQHNDLEKVMREQIAVASRYEQELLNLESAEEKNERAIENARKNYLKSMEQLNKNKLALSDLEQAMENKRKAEEMGIDTSNKSIAQLKNLKINSEQTGNAVDELARDVDEFGNAAEGSKKGIEKFNDALNSIGSAASKVAKPVGVVSGLVAGAFVGVGAVAMNEAVSVSEASTMIQNRLGLTSKETKSTMKVLENLFNDGWSSDRTELVDLITEIKQQIKGLDDVQLENVAKQVQSLSKTFGVDYNESIRAVNQMMGQFGIESEDALDIVAKGFQNGLNFRGDWLDTIWEYSVHMKSMGLSAEEFYAIFSKSMDKSAFSIDKVGDLIKESGIRMGDLSDSSRSAYESLGLDADKYFTAISNGGQEANDAFFEIIQAIRNVGDAKKRDEIATKLMGTPYEDLESSILDVFANVKDGVVDTDGTIAEMVDNMENSYSQKLQSTKNKIKSAFEPLGSELLDIVNDNMPLIMDALDSLVNAMKKIDWASVLEGVSDFMKNTLPKIIEGFSNFMGNLDDTKVKIGLLSGVFVVLAGFLAPIVLVVTKIIGSFTSLTGIFSKIFPIVKTLTSVFTKINPVMAAVSLAVGAAILIFNNWDKVKEIMTAVGEKIKDVVEKIKGFFSNLYEKVSETVSNLFSSISKVFSNIYDKVSEIASNIVSGVVKTFNNFKKTVSNIFTTFKDAITKTFGSINLLGKAKAIINGIKTGFTNAWNAVSTWLSTKVTWIKTRFDFNLLGKAKAIINSVKTGFTNAWGAVSTWFSTKITWIKTRFDFDISGKGKAIINSVKNGFTNAWGNVTSWISTKKEWLKGAFKVDLKGVGSSIVEGLKNGITGAWSSVTKKVTSLVNSIPKKAKELLKINSPSKVMAKIAESIPEGIAVGIDRKTKFVTDSMKNLTKLATIDIGSVIDTSAISSLNKTVVGGSMLQGSSNTYAPNITVNALDSNDILRKQQSLLRRESFKGGVL